MLCASCELLKIFLLNRYAGSYSNTFPRTSTSNSICNEEIKKVIPCKRTQKFIICKTVKKKDHNIETNMADGGSVGWSRVQILTLVMMMLAQFCVLCSYSLLAPFFPQEATEKGLDDITVGILFATYQLVMFIMAPVYGVLVS